MTKRWAVCDYVMNLPRLFLKTLLASLFLALFASGIAAQTADACHVYVVDVERARRAFKVEERSEDEQAGAKAFAAAQTIFPEFQTKVGEEQLTTKHYSFPGSKLIITASVYYTDESMVSYRTAGDASDSILIGITVGNKGKASAFDEQVGSAIAEATNDEHTNKLRAKQYVKVRGRMYLVGIECNCMAGKKPE